ncbi:hypothetical protein ACTFIU_009587 [Dictyostelium citrinum]
MFNSLKSIIVSILFFSNYFVFCKESFQTVNVDDFPPSLTLFKGSTILFVVGLNTGDHIVFTKVTPKGVEPFTSPLLNFNRLQPSFSYTFVDVGKYVIMDMYTSEEMNLTIIDILSSSSNIDSNNNQSSSSFSNSLNESSSSTKPISSLDTDSKNNSTITTSTTTISSNEKNDSIQLLNSFCN